MATARLGLTEPDTTGTPAAQTWASIINSNSDKLDAHNHLQSGGSGTGAVNGAPVAAVSPVQSASATYVPTTPIYTLLINTGAAVTVTLPPSNGALGVTSGYRLTVKDATGTANVHNITVTPNGADTIDTVNGAKVINVAFSFLSLVSDGSGNWWVV